MRHCKYILTRGKMNLFSIVTIAMLTVASSCSDFLEVDLAKSLVNSNLVFSNEITATSAITGIYHDMLNDSYGFASGDNGSVVALNGLAADELTTYPGNADFEQFQQNTLVPENPYILKLWSSMYKTIYEANAVLEGLANSTKIPPLVLNQLEGEARFIRAFSHFYLVNLFGDVPLVTTTDYRSNAVISRQATSKIYDQIIEDLTVAQELLGDNYVATQRVRPNKTAATALLARAYLYKKEWANAEAEASSVISNDAYYLESDLNQVFLATSQEAIWQLRPVTPNFVTNEGVFFIIAYEPYYSALNDQVISAFEPEDYRMRDWVGSFDTGSGKVYYPYKYKVGQPAPELTEYSMVLRLAEQYLIRAEARAQQGDLANAILDVDAIRERAGLSLIQNTDPDISQANLLLAIEQERRIELLAEWGHRWLDLKRTDRANAVLGPLKNGWNDEDVLFPIPQSERNKNNNLGDQNPGY